MTFEGADFNENLILGFNVRTVRIVQRVGARCFGWLGLWGGKAGTLYVL
jgi:hypothetical protein